MQAPWTFGSIHHGRTAAQAHTRLYSTSKLTNGEISQEQTNNGTASSRAKSEPPGTRDDPAHNRPIEVSGPSDAYRIPPDAIKAIHIMGLGSIGKLIAHSLRSIYRTESITLITHRPRTFSRWLESDRTITLSRNGVTTSMEGFSMEVGRQQKRVPGKVTDQEEPLAPETEWNRMTEEQIRAVEAEAEDPDSAMPQASQSTEDDVTAVYEDSEGKRRGPGKSRQYKIANLILCVKASETVTALKGISNRLNQHSTILFVHNGMGIIDAVNESVFTDPFTRPTYLLGVISHGAKADSLFTVEHIGSGTLALGPYPAVSLSSTSPTNLDPPEPSSNARYLMQTLAAIPVLKCATFHPATLLSLQLEKLAVNAVVNPLTALMDCRNGALTYDYSIARTSRLILSEVSLILRNLPALKSLPTTTYKFSPQRLETLWVTVAHKTRNNVSSMLADVRAGRRTEIQWINGWVVKMGEALGVHCLVNYTILQMVKSKVRIVEREKRDEEVPWETQGVSVGLAKEQKEPPEEQQSEEKEGGERIWKIREGQIEAEREDEQRKKRAEESDGDGKVTGQQREKKLFGGPKL